MDDETRYIQGSEYRQSGLLSLPQYLPGHKPGDPVLEVRISGRFEIEEGGLPEGEKVILEIAPLLLKNVGDFTVKTWDKEPENLNELLRYTNPDTHLSLNLGPVRPVGENGWIYSITLPDGEAHKL